MQADDSQFTKQMFAAAAMAVLFFGSWTLTQWMQDLPGDSAYFNVLLAMSGPTLLSMAGHGSFALWFLGIAAVLTPMTIAIRKDRVSWYTALWTALAWRIECFLFGGPLLLLGAIK